MRRFVLLFALLLVSAPLFAQAPHEEWRTVETAHYRFHYPAPYEEWALRAASRMESVRERVAATVGFKFEEKVDVLIMDPYAAANGSAWPFRGAPRMILWTNPPPPESVIGYSRDWAELLTLHEDVHLVHILRPSRNALRRVTGALGLGLGPIAFAPRWVSEGYATLVEGELTGAGRPNSDIRASILRRWAQQGRLPSYSQLNSDNANWLGMSMAYLVGSSYLEWLRDRAGEDSLRNLWRRMTARQSRSFDDSFRGVFGDSPRAMYARYTAELTQKALAVEDAHETSLRDGELWQDFSWTTEAPTLTADGTKLATVIRSRENPPRLVVFDTAPDEEAEKKYRERIEKMLKRDPEDVAPVRTKPFDRKPKATLPTINGAAPFSPRWMPDAKSILYVRFEPDLEGFLHSDIYLWDTESDGVRRVTNEADVRDPDPSPDGTRAVAVRNRFGKSQLVMFSIADGAVTEITPAAVDITYDSPRFNRDGSRIAYVRFSEGQWRLIVRELATGTEQIILTPSRSVVAQPVWSGDSIVATLGVRGFIELHEFALDDPVSHQLTRSTGAALAPDVTADGTIYFLSMDADGYDIRRITVAQRPDLLPNIAFSTQLAPAIRPASPAEVPPLEVRAIGEPRPYGIGRQELMWLLGGNSSPSNENVELGLRIGDVVGRLNTLVVASLAGDRGETGGAIISTWRGSAVRARMHLFNASQDLSKQRDAASLPSRELLDDLERTGGEIAFGWDALWRSASLDLEGGAYYEDVDASLSGDLTHNGFFARAVQEFRRDHGKLQFRETSLLRYTNGDQGDASFDRFSGTFGVGVGFSGSNVWGEWSRNSVSGGSMIVGGMETTILPESVTSNRIESPALPIGVLSGDEHELRRVEVDLGFLPFTLFAERHEAWFDGDVLDHSTIRVVGAEIVLGFGPQPVIRFPGMEVRLGAGRVLDAPMEDENVWWITSRWTP